jgi:tetratricopeptide (TPR) repeat protein
MADDKTITDGQHDGDLGESVAAVFIKKLGHLFHASGRNEAGIDGFIELRELPSGRVQAQVIACQVKSGTSDISDETDDGFSWTATKGDLSYWENSNLPVIVIIVRTDPDEAWWRAVDEAFPDEAARAARVVRFDKTRDQLRGAARDGLLAAAQRDRERRRRSVQLVLDGPYAAIGLGDDLAKAQDHERAGEWHEAAAVWERIASSAQHAGLDPRLIWPALTSAAAALEQGGARKSAGELWLRLARERIDDDDPTGDLYVSRAQWTGAWTNSVDQLLLAARAHLPEAGTEAIEDLRQIFRLSKSAHDRQTAAAALVDALTFFGEYAEALEIADRVVGKRHSTTHKRQLALDRLDCAGESGQDVQGEWDELIEDWRDRGPYLYARVLQRRAVYEVRHGRPDEAGDFFRRAAQVWAATDGAEEQVAEIAFSAAMVEELVGRSLSDDGPPGSRAAGVIARGSIRTPAVRSDRLLHAGQAYVVDKRLPDAIARLTMAAMLDRRAGNLSSWRSAMYLLARTYDAADEHIEALRLWLLIGANARAIEAAKQVAAEDVLKLARLEGGPGWQRSAGFSALEAHAATFDARAVARIARATVQAAQEPPTLLAAHPSMQARRVLAKLARRIPKRYAHAAGGILAEEVRRQSPNAPEASAGLAALTQRKLYDGLPAIVDAILMGRDLPVTIAGWLREADEKTVAPLIAAGLEGNLAALGELAAADIPRSHPGLRRACDEVTGKATASDPGEGGQVFGLSFTSHAHIARYARPGTQWRWVEMLCEVVDDVRCDDVSKTSALIALAVAAPDLSVKTAGSALRRLLAIAAGTPTASAPAVLTDHPNAKRARSTFTRSVPDDGLREATIQACGRLARRAGTKGSELEEAFVEAVSSGRPRLIRMALRELSELPGIGGAIDPKAWLRDDDPEVRAAARLLDRARRDTGRGSTR